MTASGIDRTLKFRHLFILRRGNVPSGPKTKALVDQFEKAGGKFIAPTDDDLRVWVALQAMARRDPPGFELLAAHPQAAVRNVPLQGGGFMPAAFLVPVIADGRRRGSERT